MTDALRPSRQTSLRTRFSVGASGPVERREGDAFLEVQMDRMIPAAAAIDERDVLDVARLREQQRDPVGVHDNAPLPPLTLMVQGKLLVAAAIRNAAVEAAAAAAELDGARAGRLDERDLLGERRRHALLRWRRMFAVV